MNRHSVWDCGPALSRGRPAPAATFAVISSAMHGARAYVALGSNLGDRRAHLRAALRGLSARGFAPLEVSSIYETAPVGGPEQGSYLNAVAAVPAIGRAAALLHACLQVEHSLGRVRTIRNGPRTIDLDVLLFGHERSADPEVTIPHPRLHERAFVLAPLAEIAPALVPPGQGATVADLLARSARGGVARQGTLA